MSDRVTIQAQFARYRKFPLCFYRQDPEEWVTFTSFRLACVLIGLRYKHLVRVRCQIGDGVIFVFRKKNYSSWKEMETTIISELGLTSQDY